MICPQNKNEMEMLIYALNTPRLDTPPSEKNISALEEKLRGILSEEFIAKFASEFYQQNIEAYTYMLTWGKNRGKAARNYFAHLQNYCQPCFETAVMG